jgi:hypothetical protein
VGLRLVKSNGSRDAPRPTNTRGPVGRFARAAVVLSLALSPLYGCVGPARSSAAYTDKGQSSAAASLSAVRSAELAIDDLRQDGLFAPQLSIVMSAAADDASSAESTFASIQPPDPSLDRYRNELTAVLGEATDALAAMRIDARRTDPTSMLARASTLSRIAQELEHFAGDQA